MFNKLMILQKKKMKVILSIANPFEFCDESEKSKPKSIESWQAGSFKYMHTTTWLKHEQRLSYTLTHSLTRTHTHTGMSTNAFAVKLAFMVLSHPQTIATSSSNNNLPTPSRFINSFVSVCVCVCLHVSECVCMCVSQCIHVNRQHVAYVSSKSLSKEATEHKVTFVYCVYLRENIWRDRRFALLL